MVVSVLAFYSNDLSSNPAKVYNFSVKLNLKRTKINKKRAGLAHLKNILAIVLTTLGCVMQDPNFWSVVSDILES